jgi:hypothetical protein
VLGSRRPGNGDSVAFVLLQVATHCLISQPREDRDTMEWLLNPLGFGKKASTGVDFDEMQFGPEITRERIFDRSVTARSNYSLMFVCNKTSMPGGGLAERRRQKATKIGN